MFDLSLSSDVLEGLRLPGIRPNGSPLFPFFIHLNEGRFDNFEVSVSRLSLNNGNYFVNAAIAKRLSLDSLFLIVAPYVSSDYVLREV